jgi:uncharacterized protein (DUF1800 family)
MSYRGLNNHGKCFTALALWGVVCAAIAQQPVITSISFQNNTLVLSAHVPPGHRHAVLEAGDIAVLGTPQPLVAGAMNGSPGLVTFRVPNPGTMKFLRVRVGPEATVPPATHSGADFFSVDYNAGPGAPLTESEKIGHVLNRLAYGPSDADVQRVQALSVSGYIEQQLQPETIDESDNSDLVAREAELFTEYRPAEDTMLVRAGDTWRYFKGTQEPPANWKALGFDDRAWLQGPTGIGYGDGDDATVLQDMRQSDTTPGYLSVYLRKTFQVADPAAVDALILSVDFDDGFVAYLNGVEVARENLAGNPPAHNAATTNDHEAGSPVAYDLSARKGLLRAGDNVLAVQAHNGSLTSSDFSIIPELASRKYLPQPPQRRIKGIDALQQLVHVRGVYARRQLQTVLAEFWDNHFTTDYDKVAAFFAGLRNSDARPAMSETQAAAEAAQAEYEEYQFFYDHALGNFGDLLLYSATSPTQLIYLDNVLNVKGAPNENYAREILELFAFGVDNRYTQQDIEQLARCFTGWSVRKVWPDQKQPFPASARTPPTEESVQFEDTILLDVGPGWKYFKGTAEPTPNNSGAPTITWTTLGFNDSAWLDGATSIGYGDDDDATVLTDMPNRYVSVYLRRTFTLADPAGIENLMLSVDYDDGFVAYLNGVEVARSETMRDTGSPPPYSRTANGSHEAGQRPDTFSLREFQSLLRPAPAVNVLAIQAHNVSRDSSDFSIHPRFISRRLLPGSIENGDPNGVWTFRFNPDEHDTGAKTLFAGTPYQITIPAGRTGRDGLRDALDVIDTFVNHPSVSEFICLKLINKFVSDDITLTSYKDGTAPAPLRQLLDEAIAAWHSTTPAGNIRTVLRAILRPTTQDSYFWSRPACRSKVKTAIEFINSSARVLGVALSGTSLPEANDSMGMHLFTRDDPDGWSEIGLNWIDTGTMLARIQFAQALAGNRVNGVSWDTAAWLSARNLTTAESIVDYFNQLLFQGQMADSNRRLLIEFASTDDAGNPLPFSPQRGDYLRRVRDLVGLILSMPQCHYQ